MTGSSFAEVDHDTNCHIAHVVTRDDRLHRNPGLDHVSVFRELGVHSSWPKKTSTKYLVQSIANSSCDDRSTRVGLVPEGVCWASERFMCLNQRLATSSGAGSPATAPAAGATLGMGGFLGVSTYTAGLDPSPQQRSPTRVPAPLAAAGGQHRITNRLTATTTSPARECPAGAAPARGADRLDRDEAGEREEGPGDDPQVPAVPRLPDIRGHRAENCQATAAAEATFTRSRFTSEQSADRGAGPRRE